MALAGTILLIDKSNNYTIFVVRSGSRLCAFPLDHVIETMRPLAIEPIRDLPPFVRGLSVIRGLAVPVVDLSVILGESDKVPASRFVLLRLGERRVAIAVSEVLGLRQFEGSTLRSFSPLLEEAFADLVTALQVRDRELLIVLESARLVPEEVWRMLDSVGVSS